jgi:hypothetical protein
MSDGMSISIGQEVIVKAMERLVQDAVSSGFGDLKAREAIGGLVRDAVTEVSLLEKIQEKIAESLDGQAQQIAEMISANVGAAVVTGMKAQLVQVAIDSIYAARFGGCYYGTVDQRTEKEKIRREVLGLPDLDPARDAEIEALRERLTKEQVDHAEQQGRLGETIDEYRRIIDELKRSEDGKLVLSAAEARMDERIAKHYEREQKMRQAAAIPDETT